MDILGNLNIINGLNATGTTIMQGVGDTSTTNTLLLQDSGGTTTMVVKDNGFVGINSDTPTLGESLRVQSGMTVQGFQANQLFVHPTADFVGVGGATTQISNETFRSAFHIVSGAYISTSNAIPSNAGLNMATNDKINVNNAAILGMNTASTITQLDSGSAGMEFRDPTDAVMAKFDIPGNFGIGTTPTAKLHVKGAGTGATTDALLIQNSDSTNLMVVEDGGDVGIGTIAPSEKLDVVGNINIDGFILSQGYSVRQLGSATIYKTSGTGGYIWNDNTDANNIAKLTNDGRLIIGNGIPDGEIETGVAARFKSQLSSDVNKEVVSLSYKNSTDNVGIGVYSNNTDAYLHAVTSTALHEVNLVLGGFDGSNFLETLVVSKDDNVGIGTATPTAKLHLDNGDFRVDGTSVDNIIFADFSSNFVGVGNPSTPLRANLHVNQSSGVADPSVVSNNSGLVVSASLSNSALRLGIDSTFKAYIAGGRTNTTASTVLQINPLGANVEILPIGLGNVGIGLISPTAKLHVKGAGTGATTDALLIQNSGSTNLMVVEDGGDVGIGTIAPSEKLDVNGNARFRNIGSSASAGALHYASDGTLTVNTSDISMKENISTIDDSLGLVNQLNGVYFDWKENGEKSVGLIAQEVESVMPELSFVNPNTGLKGVHYDKVVSVLINAVKELSDEIKKLKGE